jgi:hypothetical protein
MIFHTTSEFFVYLCFPHLSPILIVSLFDGTNKFQEEYQQVLHGRPPKIEDLPYLPLTRMVVEEAMRLYPPAWGLGRRALGNDEIGGYAIPKGAYVLIPPTSRIVIRPSGSDPTRSIPNGSRHSWWQDAIALPTSPLGAAHACVLAISLRSTKRS